MGNLDNFSAFCCGRRFFLRGRTTLSNDSVRILHHVVRAFYRITYRLDSQLSLQRSFQSVSGHNSADRGTAISRRSRGNSLRIVDIVDKATRIAPYFGFPCRQSNTASRRRDVMGPGKYCRTMSTRSRAVRRSSTVRLLYYCTGMVRVREISAPECGAEVVRGPSSS